MSENYSQVVNTARDYYNSSDADQFYYNVWGGEDIHIGLYSADRGESISDASRKTVEKISSFLNLSATDKMIDIGAGYGGSARFVVDKFQCQVACLNISEEQNERNRKYNLEKGLQDRISVIDGSFEDIPFPNASFDAAWSQDAILHSGNKLKVFEEVSRILKPGADFIFSDPMQSKDADSQALQPVLARIHLDSMGSFELYQQLGEKTGLRLIEIDNLTENLIFHYSHVLHEIENRYEEIKNYCSEDYLERMKTGLKHWISAGKSGNLNWGILHFRKDG